MDEITTAVEGAPETTTSDDNTLEESPTTEQTTEDTTKEASEEVETAGEPKKGSQSRIKELVKERNDARAEIKSLADKLAEVTGSTEPTGQTPFTPQYQPGEEVSPERLSQDVTKTAQAIVELQIKQNNAVNRINNESRDVVRKYPQLDPENADFESELSETITEATEAYVRSQPYSASVSNFVDKLMKPYNRAVAKEVGQATEKIAKQVSETALRPTSIRKDEKSASEKSIAELEAELGFVH